MATGFRDIPSVDAVLSHDRIQRLVQRFSRGSVLDLVRTQLADAREAVRRGEAAQDVDGVVAGVEARAASEWQPWPRPVINATGVVLHTNLGRAPLSADAVKAASEAAARYNNLELDLTDGKRGSRNAHISSLVEQLTGAEAALAVNNNASAMLLGLAAVAAGREVIVSRSEAVEIGGGFRVPEVLRQSGATLVDVGTTNRTYAKDYANAITENTAAILAVHASNFRVEGFVHSPTIEELGRLGKERGVPVLHDLGSGCLLDTGRFGLAHEPMPQESIAAGVSLAFFSGDKLLGGPQAGIIAGTADLVARVAAHPLARAVRADKMTMAALSATLLHYVRDEAEEKIPIWRMIAATADDIGTRAAAWRNAVGGPTSLVPGVSTIGGGSVPGETLPTTLLSIDPATYGGPDRLAARLRGGDPPVMARIADEQVLLDPRTVPPEEDDALVNAVREALANE